MGMFARIGAATRRHAGRAAHGAGAATRSDVRALRAELAELRAELGAVTAKLSGLVRVEHRIDVLDAKIEWLDRVREDVHSRLASVQTLVEIDAFSRFIGHSQLASRPLVSVVLPTYNRPDSLRRAIDSVRAQRYEHWELLIVDDGGEADSAAVANEAGDDRVRWMQVPHGGACAARNAGLDRAQGEIIAYADDDNVMDRDWLYSVVWAFGQRPDTDVLYGAFVIDDVLRVDGKSSGDLPRAFLRPYSREALLAGNLADMGTIAHRRGLPEARFNEGLTQMGDWDLLLRLTERREPLVLPAIACYYLTDAPNRLTLGPTGAEDHAAVVSRAASRPL